MQAVAVGLYKLCCILCSTWLLRNDDFTNFRSDETTHSCSRPARTLKITTITLHVCLATWAEDDEFSVQRIKHKSTCYSRRVNTATESQRSSALGHWAARCLCVYLCVYACLYVCFLFKKGPQIICKRACTVYCISNMTYWHKFYLF